MKAASVSRQAIHRWLGWYESQGLSGLADRSHRPPRCAHQMDPAIEVWVLETRRRNPDWGPRRLVHEAARAGLRPVPSRSGVYRPLKRAELIDPEARRHRDRRFKRWERGGAMELWQMDVVGGVLFADGTEAKILTGIAGECAKAELIGLDHGHRVTREARAPNVAHQLEHGWLQLEDEPHSGGASLHFLHLTEEGVATGIRHHGSA